jgi:serine/threonine-protein kinase
VIEKLHAKLPGDRFESAAEVAELLGQCLAHLQQPEVHTLPESVATLSHDASKTASLRDVLLKKPRTALAVFTTSTVLLASAVWIATHGANVARPVVEPDYTLSEQSERSRTSESLIRDFDPATDWDASDQWLQQVTSQVGEFTSRTDRLWDDVPSYTQVQSESLPKEPLE